jgi:lysosomal Pro-X carboxypeptidase
MIQRNASIALFFLVCLLSTLNVSAWKPPHRFPRPLHAQPRSTDASSSEFIYETRFFTNKVDHFSFRPKSYRTYQQRYLFNDTFWDRSQGAMFFYAGNEGSIEWFARNTGFMWQLAQQQKALLVFAEHRFYGASMPSKGHLSLLTAEQALADFAVLLTSLKQNLTAQSTPVIAFGGSYGGMLAAWMRLKYPHVISGAIASSAPILWFEDLTPVDSFERIVTNNFRAASQSCVNAINSSWAAIDEVVGKDGGVEALARTFKVCKLDGAEGLKGWLQGAWLVFNIATDMLLC